MKADRGGRKQLTATPVPEQEPTWSPDGSRIAFAAGTSDTDATTDLEIWVMNADGSGLTQLTNNAGGSDDTEPAWSPLGNQIAFRGDGQPSDTNNNIYVMDTDPTTNDAVNLTPNDFTVTPVYQFNEESPSWSPDGTQITYSTSLDIWKMDTNAATTDWTNLTKTPTTNDTHPSWAPDDDSIVYSRTDVDNGVNNPNIYVVGAGGGTQTPVDTTPRKDEKPNWQPIPVCTQNVNDNNDPLVGTAGKDVLCGDNRNNTIKGTGGNDIILGKGGNDKLTGALGNDTLNGGPGTDTTLYTDSTAVKANLTTEFATGVGSDVLLAVENLTGSGGDDQLRGSAVANVLVGGAGADDLFGLGGADTLNSKDGISSNDTLSGGPGTDTCIKDATEVSITS